MLGLNNAPQNSEEYPGLKNNLRVFNSILKRKINGAKTIHYENLFNWYSSNIKMIWNILKKLYANQAVKETN